jgi:AcrR family transcriptional regulator
MTGRRGHVVRQAVLAATLAELVDVGYAALTIDNVATRAGVHKTTVYRRWADRESLVTDAVLEEAATDFEIPDTADIDTDLRTAVRNLAAWLTGPVGTPLVALLRSDASRLPGLADAKLRFFAARSQAVRGRVDSAAEAGQLPVGIDPMALLSTLTAPIYLNLLVLDRVVTPDDCDRAVRIALTAARAGLLGPGS